VCIPTEYHTRCLILREKVKDLRGEVDLKNGELREKDRREERLENRVVGLERSNAHLVAEADARWPWYVWAGIGSAVTLATGLVLALAF
jgi:hypothetical protein